MDVGSTVWSGPYISVCRTYYESERRRFYGVHYFIQHVPGIKVKLETIYMLSNGIKNLFCVL